MITLLIQNLYNFKKKHANACYICYFSLFPFISHKRNDLYHDPFLTDKPDDLQELHLDISFLALYNLQKIQYHHLMMSLV